MTNTEIKSRAHTLIDHMGSKEVAAVVGLLEVMLDPVSLALANAPLDDEPVSDEEADAVAKSKLWLQSHEPIAHEDVLAEFGLTLKDFDRMASTPLENHDNGQ